MVRDGEDLTDQRGSLAYVSPDVLSGEGGREGGREGGKEEGRRWREGMEGGMEGGREGGREDEIHKRYMYM